MARALALIAALAVATGASAHEETALSAEEEQAKMRESFAQPEPGVPFAPLRILMHDTTCGPALVDIAAMRDFTAARSDDSDDDHSGTGGSSHHQPSGANAAAGALPSAREYWRN